MRLSIISNINNVSNINGYNIQNEMLPCSSLNIYPSERIIYRNKQLKGRD